MMVDAAGLARCQCEALCAKAEQALAGEQCWDVSTQTNEDVIDVCTAEAILAEAVQIGECDAACAASAQKASDATRQIMAEAIDEEDPAEELRSTASQWFGSL